MNPKTCLRSVVLTGVGGLLMMVCTNSAHAGEAAAPKKDEVVKEEAPRFPSDKAEIIQQVEGLIAKLGADDPEKREEATKALIQLYPQAVLYIEKAVEKATDPETKMRLELVTAQPHKGLSAYRFPRGLPEGVTAEKLKGLSAVAAPNARIAYDSDLKLLVIAGDDQKELRSVEALLKVFGVEAEANRVAEKRGEKPEGEVALRRKLSRRVSFEFVDTPIPEALAFVQTLSRVGMILDPKVDEKGLKPVSLRVTDLDLMTALTWICNQSGLAVQLRDEGLFITQAEARQEIDEGLSVYRLRQGAPDDPTVEKVKELSAVAAPNARIAYDRELKVLAIACDEQKDSRRVEAVLKVLGSSAATNRDLKVLVIAGDEQKGRRRVEALLNVLGIAAETEGARDPAAARPQAPVAP